MRYSKKEIGQWGEDQASFFLQKNGHRIIERNYYCPVGELDIISRNTEDVLCFIEVKTRRGQYGSGERATDERKVQKMIASARYYCWEHDIDPYQELILFYHISIYKASEASISIYMYELSINHESPPSLGR